MKNLGVTSKLLKATKTIKKPEHSNTVKENIPMIPDYNEQADILFLPKDKHGYQYLLVVTDLATNKFDMEPLKNKDSKTVLEAMTKMFKTSTYIKQPQASLSTDAGSEFKDKVDKWLYDKNIYHKTSLPGRHSQTANVESLNRVLGRILNNYMSQQELDTGTVCKEWTEILPALKKELNEYRENPNMPKNVYDYKYPDFTNIGTAIKDSENKDSETKETKPKEININNLFKGKTDGKVYLETQPKFKVGQMVYRKLDKPRNALGHNQPTEKFREGDVRIDIIEPRKIKRVLYMNTEPYYRYILNDVPGVSYPENELKKATERVEKVIINRISSRMTKDGLVYYKVHWKNAKLHKPSWELRTELMKDVPDLIHEYDMDH